MKRIKGVWGVVAAVVLLVAVGVACSNTCSAGAICGDYNTIGPSTPFPSPTPIPTASVSPTINPCSPVTNVNVSGAREVRMGEVLTLSVTPVSPSGPLEGPFDYCNVNRYPTIERASSNLRCVGSCGGWAPQFQAVAVGPFEVQIRVEGAVSPVFAGTVR